MVRARTLWACMLCVVVALGGESAAHGQTSELRGEQGFQPNRDYLSLLPFETIDTASNNVILRFTDLTLPGNGGRALRFDRVFSNLVIEDPSGPQWRFGIAGVPMKVIERPHPTFENPIEPAGDIAAERLTAPYFWMLDGSRLETTYVEPPGPLTWQKVQTVDFRRYDREARVLRMPDGTVAQYDTEGHLVRIGSAFAGPDNAVTLTWSPGEIVVVQSLGNGQTRRVTLTLDEATGRTERLTYLDRTWTYTWDGTQLASVRPPEGPVWAYRYSADPFSVGKIAGVTTPLGGGVEYAYEDREFFVRGTQGVETFNVLAARRVHDRGHRVGEWTFEYSATSDLAFDRTVVATPSGVAVTYVYGGYSPQENVLAGTWLLRFQYVHAPDGSTLETREWEYALLKSARTDGGGAVPWGVPRVVRRRVIRAGQTYDTEYEYGSDLSLHPFHDFHRPITVTERRPGGAVARRTRLAYVHLCHTPTCDGPAFLGLPRSEEATVAGMTVRNEWTYNQLTGFRESETRHGFRTTYEPDALGNVARVTRGNGGATAYTYSWGAVDGIRTAEVVVGRQINPDGTAASETIAGRTTTYSDYDRLMRLGRTQPPGPVSPIVTLYDDANGTVTTTRGSAVVTTVLDGFGRPASTINGAGVRTRTAYDADGRRSYQSYPFEGDSDVGTVLTYDPLGRLRSEANPDGTERRWLYDDARNTVTVVDEENRSTVYGYLGFGHPDDARLVSVTDANQQTWAYEYDAIGNLSRVVTPTGEARVWLRDTRGLVTSETHPESGTTFYTHYDDAGVLKRKVDARGTEFTYAHDGSDRVTRVTAGTQVTEISYETGSDNRSSVRNDDVVTSFAYDAAGRVSQRQDIVGPHVFVSRYEYDGNDRVVAVTYPSGRIIGYDRQSDPEGRVARVFETAAGRDHAIGMSYHASGDLRGYTSGNLIRTTIDYDPLRYWVTGIRSGPLSLTYGGYDRVGNVGAIGDSRPGMDQAFTYDALDRLNAVSGPYGSAQYAYDAHGNQTGAGGASYVYEPGTLRLANRAGVSYGYDGNGNLTALGAGTFSHTPDSLLASATVNGITTAYAYDGDGRRVRKTTPDETTIYLRGLNGEVLTEWRRTGAATLTRDYVYAGTTLVSTVDRESAPDLTACGGKSTPVASPGSLTIAPGATGTATFEGTACRRVSVLVAVTSGAFGCTWSIVIRKPDGRALSGGSVTGCNAKTLFVEPVTLPASGIYTVIVDPAGTSSGSAVVGVWDVVDIGGTVTPDGPAVSVPMVTPGQVARYTFDGTAGARISVQMDATWTMKCGWVLTMLNPDGSLLGTAVFCSNAVAFIEPRTLPVSGRYTVVVNPKEHYLGTVSLAVRTVVDAQGSIDTAGTPVTVPITTAGQTGRLRLDGVAGARVSLRLDASWEMGCRWKLSLLKPDGTTLGTATSCSDEVAFMEPRTLPVTGTYTVLVDPDVHYLGTVTARAFTFTDITGPIRTDGTPVAVSVTVPGQHARLTFNGTAGQVRSVTLTAAWKMGCTWGLTLLKPDGSTLATGALCGGTTSTVAPRTLPVSGTYTVLVDPKVYYLGTVSVAVK